MKRAEALAVLQEHRDELQSMGVKSLALFGSVARDEARPDSDVDLLVEFDGRPIGLFAIAHMQEYLEGMFPGAKVDLVIRRAVFPEFKENIEREAVDVF